MYISEKQHEHMLEFLSKWKTHELATGQVTTAHAAPTAGTYTSDQRTQELRRNERLFFALTLILTSTSFIMIFEWVASVLGNQWQQLERSTSQLRTALDAAQEAAEQKSRFLANMSHEIRTPMSGILGLTNVLLHNNPRVDQRRYLE